jgi:hypothetical protein
MVRVMRDGLIPTALGTAVTLGAATMRKRELDNHSVRKKDVAPTIETALIGFGLAHIVLGAIELWND